MSRFPSISEYNSAIRQGSLNMLSDLVFIPSRTVPVKIFTYGSGAYAAVFKASRNGGMHAVRCFISAEQSNIDRYKALDRHLARNSASWVVPFNFLESEINVGTNYYPVIRMDWVEGKLLNQYVDTNLYDNRKLSKLQEQLVEVSKSLESMKIGHGDIQCGNIIVQDDNTGNPLVRLIDYDGMYIPSFENLESLETGRSEFQHPRRTLNDFNERIDRFSFWVILCAIEALKFDKGLWLPVMQGGFNTLDNMLFIAQDFQNMSSSGIVKKMREIGSKSVEFYLDKIQKSLLSSPSKTSVVELWHSDRDGRIPTVNPVGIYSTIEGSSATDTVANFHTSETILISSEPAGATVLSSDYQKLGQTPVFVGRPGEYPAFLLVTYGTKIQRVELLSDSAFFMVDFQSGSKGQEAGTATTEESILVSSNSAILVTQHSNPPVGNNVIATPALTVAPSKSSSDKVQEWVVLGIVLLTLLAILYFVFISDKRSGAESSTNTNQGNIASTNVIDSSASMRIVSSANDRNLPGEPVSDTVQNVIFDSTLPSVTDNHLVPTESVFDQVGVSAVGLVTAYFDALKRQDCSEAWSYTFKLEWEALGESWFCSDDGVGRKHPIYDVKTFVRSTETHQTVIGADYFTYSADGRKLCIFLDFTVRKIAFDDGITRWMIVDSSPRETASEC